MSLESGRKLGLTASIIAIILPIVAIAGLGSIMFAAISSAMSGVTSPIGSGIALTVGLVAFAVALLVMAIVAFVCFVVAMYRLSHYYNEPAIFKNILYAILVAIISIVVIVIVEVLFLTFTIGSIGPVTDPSNVPTFVSTIFLSYIAIIIVGIALGIASAVFVWRAFNKLGEKSGVDSLKTAGLLYLIGIIVPFVAWIGWIFAAIGFHRLQPATTQTVSYPTSPPPVTMVTKRCPYCSTENVVGATYCRFCGKPL